jgi:hypothetical protein
MTHDTRTIHVNPGSELDALLNAADEAPVSLERDGVLYELQRAQPSGASVHLSREEVVRSIAGIHEASGAWGDIDAEALKAYIRDRRRTKNRPSIEQ